MLTCPVCKASNDQGPQCRRCRADLSLLFTLERQRSGELDNARVAIRAGEFADAAQALGRAAAVRDGADVRRLRTLYFLMKRRFADAWAEYRTVPGQASVEP